MTAYEGILFFGIGAYSMVALAVFSALGAKRWKKRWLFKFHHIVGTTAFLLATVHGGLVLYLYVL